MECDCQVEPQMMSKMLDFFSLLSLRNGVLGRRNYFTRFLSLRLVLEPRGLRRFYLIGDMTNLYRFIKGVQGSLEWSWNDHLMNYFPLMYSNVSL